jgi:hypothetical protein
MSTVPFPFISDIAGVDREELTVPVPHPHLHLQFSLERSGGGTTRIKELLVRDPEEKHGTVRSRVIKTKRG